MWHVSAAVGEMGEEVWVVVAFFFFKIKLENRQRKACCGLGEPSGDFPSPLQFRSLWRSQGW